MSSTLKNHRDQVALTRRGIMRALVAGAAVSGVEIVLPRSAIAQTARAVSASRIDAAMNAAFSKYGSLNEGKNADYIPYLAQVDSKLFGISAVTTDNQSYSVGDTDYAFSIQSISKVFTLALAIAYGASWLVGLVIG